MRLRLGPIPALLLAAVLAPPLAAQIPDALRTAPRVQGAGNGSTIVIWPRHVQSLQARLDSFAVALPAAERALWNDVLLRAAHSPTPAAADVRVTPVLQIGPGGGCEDTPGMDDAANRAAIIVQGGRMAGAGGIVVQGGRTPRAGIIVQGGRAPGAQGAHAPRPNQNATVDSKLQPVPWLTSESLGRRLADLSPRLTSEERGALDWLLTRAAEPSGPDGGLPPRTPGDPRPGERVSLRQALGIDPLAIGPKQDDPAPRPDAQRWILRF